MCTSWENPAGATAMNLHSSFYRFFFLRRLYVGGTRAHYIGMPNRRRTSFRRDSRRTRWPNASVKYRMPTRAEGYFVDEC